MIKAERSLTRRVLLAGYDDALRKTMKAALEQQGFRVVAAGSVAEAIRFIAAGSFHLLFSLMSLRDSQVLTVAFHEQGDYKGLVVTPHQLSRDANSQVFEPRDPLHAEHGVFSRRSGTRLSEKCWTHLTRTESVMKSVAAFLDKGFRSFWRWVIR